MIMTACSIVFRAYGSGKEDSPLCDAPGCEKSKMTLIRHVSFVDCPVSNELLNLVLNVTFMVFGVIFNHLYKMGRFGFCFISIDQTGKLK